MLLDVHHETRYDYQEPVRYSIQVLRLTPRADPGQRVLSWQVHMPGQRLEQVDPFGNRTQVVTTEEPHRSLRILVSGRVEVDAEDRPMPPATDELSPLAYLAPTPLTRPDAALRELAERHLGRHPASRESLLDLVHGIRAAVGYEPGITDVTRSAAEALDLGAGVCQDQAHVLVACCRAVRVPARYVSGYSLDEVSGEVASHAWAEVHVDPLGWVGYDISNGISPDERYVRVATGLDYAEAAPVVGIHLGESAGESLAVAIDVQQIQQ